MLGVGDTVLPTRSIQSDGREKDVFSLMGEKKMYYVPGLCQGQGIVGSKADPVPGSQNPQAITVQPC